MAISFDDHQLLTRSDPQIPQLKRYHYNLNGLQVQSYDTGLFVYYKRQWKAIQLKNLSEGMQVAYQVKRSQKLTFERDAAYLQNALALFKGFDEEAGQPYHFLPFCKKSPSELQSLFSNQKLSAQLATWQGGTRILGLQADFQRPQKREEKIWFLFSLALLYGKFDLKNAFLSAFKVHFPLVWAAAALQEQFELLLQEMQDLGIFISSHLHEQGSKKVLELSSSDFELMDLFSGAYQALNLGELNLWISPAQSKNHEIKTQLLDFLKKEKTESLTEELLDQLTTSTLKFLKY